MTKNTKYILLGAAVIWLLFGRTIDAFYNMLFKLYQFTIVSFSKDSTVIRVDVACKNTTTKELYIRTIDFDVYFNDQYVAHINNAVNRRIAANSTDILPVLITVDNTKISNSVLQQLSTGIIDNWSITLKGRVSVDNIYLPLNMSFLASELLYD